MTETMRAVGKAIHSLRPIGSQFTVGRFSISPLLIHSHDAGIKGGKGDADALFIDKIPKPQPKDTDAIVKIKAFGLNRMDLLQREGMYPVPPQAPKTLGVEFSGIIESFGKAAEKDFKVGDEVFGLAYGGP